MMIDAVMYGMIPNAKMAKLVSAPPENRFSSASTPPVELACSRSEDDGVKVDARHRHLGAQPVRRDDEQREHDLPAQILNPEDVAHVAEHDEPLAIGVLVALGRRPRAAEGGRQDLDAAAGALDGLPGPSRTPREPSP